MSQSHAKRGTDSPQTKHKKRRVNKQNSLTQYGLTGSGTRLLESHGIFTDLYQAIVRMHQTLIFLLKLSFHRLGCCSIKSSAPRKIFHPFFHPNHPCQDENPHHRRLQEDRHRRQKTDTAARRHHTDTEGDRHLRLREDRHRHQKTSSTTPRRSTPPNPRRTKTPEEQSPLSSECREYFVSNITPPPPPHPQASKSKSKSKFKAIFFLSQANTNKGTTFLFQLLFHFFQFFFKTKE